MIAWKYSLGSSSTQLWPKLWWNIGFLYITTSYNRLPTSTKTAQCVLLTQGPIIDPFLPQRWPTVTLGEMERMEQLERLELSQSRRYKRDFSLGDHDFFADSYLFGMSQDIMIAKHRKWCIFGVDFSGVRDHMGLLLTQNHPLWRLSHRTTYIG